MVRDELRVEQRETRAFQVVNKVGKGRLLRRLLRC